MPRRVVVSCGKITSSVRAVIAFVQVATFVVHIVTRSTYWSAQFQSIDIGIRRRVLLIENLIGCWKSVIKTKAIAFLVVIWSTEGKTKFSRYAFVPIVEHTSANVLISVVVVQACFAVEIVVYIINVLKVVYCCLESVLSKLTGITCTQQKLQTVPLVGTPVVVYFVVAIPMGGLCYPLEHTSVISAYNARASFPRTERYALLYVQPRGDEV